MERDDGVPRCDNQGMNPEIHALTSDGVAAARTLPHLVRALNSCHHRGELSRVLPGVYTQPDKADDWLTRLQAIRAYGDDLVVTRRAAAHLSTQLTVPQPEVIDLASPRQMRAAPGYAVEQRYIPPELTTRRFGVRCTIPALTVLDLIDEEGSDAVDDALRRGIKLDELKWALAKSPGRRGNVQRREILEDSRDTPWSPLERRAHRELRAAGIEGWRTNHRVVVDAKAYFVDVAIPHLLLGFEIDGEEFHNTPEAFHRDRAKDQALGRAGWQIVHFSKQTMGDFARTAQELIEARRRVIRPWR